MCSANLSSLHWGFLSEFYPEVVRTTREVWGYRVQFLCFIVYILIEYNSYVLLYIYLHFTIATPNSLVDIIINFKVQWEKRVKRCKKQSTVNSKLEENNKV